jgi:hypothetical protein
MALLEERRPPYLFVRKRHPLRHDDKLHLHVVRPLDDRHDPARERRERSLRAQEIGVEILPVASHYSRDVPVIDRIGYTSAAD